MDANELKYILQNFYPMQSKIKFIEKYAAINDKNHTESMYYENKRTVEMIEDVLTILDDKETFIIQIHLIEHHTWMETTELFSKKFGYEKERSERTLQRFQNKAIEKMLELINNTSDRIS